MQWQPGDEGLMQQALDLARAALAGPDVPVAALVVGGNGRVLGAAVNACVRSSDPTAHAEVLALRAAARRSMSWRLDGCTLLTTVEPCTMCAGAALNARVARIVFGVAEPRTGAVGSTCDVIRDRPGWAAGRGGVEVVAGLGAEGAAALLREWFARRRAEGRERPGAADGGCSGARH